MVGAIPAEEASGTLSESITHSYICRIQVVSTTRGSAFSFRDLSGPRVPGAWIPSATH